MATPLTDSINALTQYVNETTGKQDTTLSDAVGSLAERYNKLVAIEFIQSYIVPTSWENGTEGNAPAILTAMGIDYSTLSPLEAYLCIVKDNEAQDKNYKGDMIYVPQRYSVAHIVRKNKSQITPAASNYYFYVSEGAIIDVYKLTYNLP